jgi:hypothetical protein
MRVIQSSYFTICIICLPLLVWLWGTIVNAGLAVDIRLLIKQLLAILYCLQWAAILISIPLYLRQNSVREVYFAVLTLILLPLPFVLIAWLAAATSLLAIFKMIMLQLCGAIMMAMLTLQLKQRLRMLKVDVILAVMASIFLWSTQEQWLN